MAVRRLPVVQEPAVEDAAAAARPPWHWVLIGAGFTVTLWLPILGLALWISRRLSASGALGAGGVATLVGASFAASALSSGALVGHFGKQAGLRHAIFAGLLAALALWTIALLGGSVTSLTLGMSALVVLALLASGFMAAGFHLGARARTAGGHSRARPPCS